MSSDPIIKKYPQKKQLMYEELQELPKTYNVIALSKMNKVRATQLMTLRKNFMVKLSLKLSKTKLHRELLKN